MPLHFPVPPMKAVPGLLPASDDGWAYEVKWDGMRVLAHLDGAGGVRLQSANLADCTASFPELSGLAEAVPGRPAILDGEVVALDASGRPSFGRLQQRMHVADRGEAARRAAENPVVYQVFDLLSFNGDDAITLPYLTRRRLLAEVVHDGRFWRAPAHHVGEGRALYEAVAEQGLEGLVAKRVDSPYVPGRRARTWLKIKLRRRQELVVGGWAPGQGRRAGTLGSLLVGVHETPAAGSPLRFAGRVGAGFSDAELRRLGAELAARAQASCPFDPAPPPLFAADARWVRPELVVEVEYGEWTEDGRLRHPSYAGQRLDKAPSEVVREQP
ncbi:MAG: non-homologous end-joining DNA ligase [Acidimicrobiales bacterium]